MTHTTEIDILEPIDPEKLMGALRAEIGIPAGHPFWPVPEDFRNYANAHRISSLPGGFNAALDLDVCPEGVTICGSPWHADGHWRDGDTKTESVAECSLSGQRFYVRIRLDTAYGSARRLGDLQEFHVRTATKALVALGYNGPMVIHDERDGSRLPASPSLVKIVRKC